MPTSLPQKIGRYEVVGELGRGAMGVVYKATDPNIGRMVALKTMRLDVHGVDEEEILRRFKHEAKLAGVMNHPNIVTIYDAGEDEGIFYIAMEFMEGVTLQSILHEEHSISAERILEISRQMCVGLDYAHERGVIHRDIKPANIMIHGNTGVKIMDFGIAKSGGGMTSAGQVLGTPAYMSPEQVRGKTLDGRSDLFSYGVCLYEMITGEKPFTGQNVTTIIYKIMTEAPIPPRELDVTIHPGISAVITKSLAKNPDERHQNGAELLKELESYKSFGSSADTTKVIAAVSTGAHAAAAAVAVEKATESAHVPAAATKSGDAVASASGQQHSVAASKVADKAGAVRSVESTVGVSRAAKKSGAGLILGLGKQKLAMIAGLLAVLLGVGVVFSKKGAPTDAPNPAQLQTAVAAQPTGEITQKSGTSAVEPPKSEPETAKAEVENADASKGEDGTAEKPAEAAPKKQPKTKPPVVAAAAPVQETPVSAPHVPELGSMHITSTPSGAKVSIGSTSQDEWVTPFSAHKLAPGDYELTFTKAGFVTQKRHVSVVANKTGSMGVDLVEAGAKLNITSTPAGATILVDGKPSGKVTPSVLTVDSGTHQIMVRQVGYAEENTSVTLKDGDSYTFAPKLEAKRAGGGAFRGLKRIFGGGEAIPEGKGMVQIKTNPPGAQVMHNGKPFPKATPLKGPMDPGIYQVTIRLDGYKPVRKEFTIEKGKAIEVDVDLVRK
jgi:predicted Ser/Thr protein kinase